METTSIIKSASLGGSRVKLGMTGVVPPQAPVAMREPAPSAHQSEMQALEARLKAQYESDLQARLAEERDKAREEGFQQGYKEGMSAGHADGVSAGKASLASQCAKLDGMIAQLEEGAAQFWSKTSAAVETLTMESVSQVLGEYALAPATIVGMVRQVIKKLQDSDVVHVRLHPAEHARLVEALGGDDHAVRLSMGRLAACLTPDTSLEKGGCVVETLRGDYFGTFDVQLNRLYRALQIRRREAYEPDHPSGAACA